MQGGRREELVTVRTHDMRIHGMLHLPAPECDPAPGIMILHGFTASSTSDNRLLPHQARYLADRGFAVLRFDFRGSGQSEGEFGEMTLGGEIDDATVMLDWLAARPELDAGLLGVLGFSVGGAVASCLTARRGDLIRALVLWAPVAYPYELLAGRYAERTGLPVEEVRQADVAGEAIGPAFIEELPSIRPLDAIAGSAIPMRVIVGTADATVPTGHGRDLAAAAAGPHDLIWIEGADHSFYGIPWREQLFSATADWFDRYLRG